MNHTDTEPALTPIGQQKRLITLLLLCIALFVGAVAFVTPSFSKYHGDERFYTDAALRMCATGDYWTPYYVSGKIRLLKPILTYWAEAASFKAFGISLFTSRLPSLCAGAISLALTFILGRTIFGSARIGLFGAVILASNIEFLTLSARATPDALVTCFSLLGMLGFATVWFGRERLTAGAFLAWCGIGLAVQTKGLLGLCPVAANIAFLLLARGSNWRERLRILADWRAILGGVLLASFWYVAMFRMHGGGALRDFVDDQVAAKVSISPGFILQNFAAYSIAGIRHFLPWTLLLAVGLVVWRREVVQFWREHRPACVLLLLLFPLLVLVFSFGNMRSSRYVSVSYPAFAVLLAASIDRFWLHEGLQNALKRLALVCGILLLISAGALMWLSLQTSWRLMAGSLFVAIAGGAALVACRAKQPTELWCWLGALMVCVYALFDGAIRPTLNPAPFPRIGARLLEDSGDHGKTILTYKVEEPAASQLWLATGGALEIRPVTKADLEDPKHLLLTTIEGTNTASLGSYAFEQLERTEQELKMRDAFKNLRRSDRRRNTAGRNTQYYLGVPR